MGWTSIPVGMRFGFFNINQPIHNRAQRMDWDFRVDLQSVVQGKPSLFCPFQLTSQVRVQHACVPVKQSGEVLVRQAVFDYS